MEGVGELLRSYIQKSGNTIYGIALKSGANRTTLQKVLSGERLASTELLNKILPLLKLTSDENDLLLSEVEIQRSGKTLYGQRQYIKNMLENFCSVTRGDTPLDDSPKRTSSNAFEDHGSENQHSLYQGHFAVEHLLNDLLLLECTFPSPHIYTNVPGYLNIINHILMHGIQYCINFEKLHIHHVTYFIKGGSKDTTEATQTNLSILANTLPLIAMSGFEYDIHYYYNEFTLGNSEFEAFPYYILFAKTVVLLSSDCSVAFALYSEEAEYYFRNLFDAALQNAQKLVTDCSQSHQFLSHLLNLSSNNCPLFSLEHQPCLFTFLSSISLSKYIKTVFPGMEKALDLVENRIQQLQKLSEYTCIFSKSGLLDFAANGRLADLPEEYVDPFDINDRITLLKALYEGTVNDRPLHRMVNPVMFPISEHLICFLHKDKGLDFNGFNCKNTNYNYIHITEPTILDAFEDFFHYLIESPLVYSKENTLAFIGTCIKMLETKP